MPSPFRRSLPIAGVAVLLTSALALAETPATPAPHVRPETELARGLFEELVERSATVRALVDRLEDSNVIVYVRHRSFTETLLDGRTGFVQSPMPTRVLIVELSCERSRFDQLITLGHELQHAVEIADAPHVVGAHSMAEYYTRIGVRLSNEKNAVTFETVRAHDVSVQVRRELLRPAVRTSHDRE